MSWCVYGCLGPLQVHVCPCVCVSLCVYVRVCVCVCVCVCTAGMVLAASDEDKTQVIPIGPPAGANVGERLWFGDRKEQVRAALPTLHTHVALFSVQHCEHTAVCIPWCLGRDSTGL